MSSKPIADPETLRAIKHRTARVPERRAKRARTVSNLVYLMEPETPNLEDFIERAPEMWQMLVEGTLDRRDKDNPVHIRTVLADLRASLKPEQAHLLNKLEDLYVVKGILEREAAYEVGLLYRHHVPEL